MAESVIKKKKKTINAFALLFFLAMFMCIMTWFIPAGAYAREAVDGRTVVIADSFQYIEGSPLSPWDALMTMIKGCSQSSTIFFMYLFAGAAVYMLEKTGFLGASLKRMVKAFEGREILAVTVTFLAIAAIGGTGAIGNAIVAFVPMGVLMARAMGYDALVGFMITYGASFTGFAAGYSNIYTTSIGQELAELPQLSGFGLRLASLVIFSAISLFFLLRYAKGLTAGKISSVVTEKGSISDEAFADVGEMTPRQKLIGVEALAMLGFLLYGSLKWSWGIQEIGTLFLIFALAVGATGGLGINGVATEFVNGCRSTLVPALVVGVSRAIQVAMTDGKIIDTIVHALSGPISSVGPALGVNFMFVVNLLINIIIPSGSGQAITVMPVMLPLADICHITRQTAILAFQFGDGLNNLIIPTSGLMLASIATCGIPYGKWLKWYLPVFIAHCVAACGILTFAYLTGYGPF